MLKKLEKITWLFHVPDVDKRPALNRFWRGLIYCFYDRSNLASYLYFKIFLLNVALNALFLGGYWFAFLARTDVHLGIVRIDYSEDTIVDQFLHDYPTTVFTTLIAVTLLYAWALFYFKTSYFHDGNLKSLSQKQTTDFCNPTNPEPTPFVYFRGLLFFTAGLCFLWSIPDYFRRYELYSWLHDYQAQSAANMVTFSVIYMALYHLIIIHGVASPFVNGIRSLLRNRILKGINSND